MSMCGSGSVQNMFENSSLPENPTFLESLSWNQIKQPAKISAELHLKESPLPSSSFPETINLNPRHMHNDEYVSNSTNPTTPHKNSDSSLHLCTEGLGFESSDDVEDSKNSGSLWWQSDEREKGNKKRLGLEDFCYGEWRTRSSIRVRSGVEYPPPISCIGKSGKPWVTFMSYRDNERFVLKEIRTPIQEFLHAHREDGRLKLHFLQPEDEEEKDDDDDDHHQEDCVEVKSADEGEKRV